MRIQLIRFLTVVVSLLGTGSLPAQPQGPQPWWPAQPRSLPFLHPLFSNDMVLQRDLAAPIWGWSSPGDRIVVKVDGNPAGQTAIAAADGRWATKIGPFAAGGPHVIAVEGQKRRETIANVLFGDVWLCSGQSNMNWPVRLSNNADEEVKKANYPEIRSFTVGFYPSLVPMQLPPPARWEVCTPEFARNFTGVGYFFARAIHARQKIPIGIIHSSVGASAAEAWTSGEALRKHMTPKWQDLAKRLDELDRAVAVGGLNFDFFREIDRWTAKIDPQSARRKYSSDPQLDTKDWIDVAVPKPWHEAGLKDFNGLVWFRRNIDVPQAWQGKDLTLTLSVINDVDVIWFNGTLIGSRQIPGTSRIYHVDAKLVQPGKNLLALAIVNKAGPGGFCGAANGMIIRPATNAGNQLVRLDGTWKAKRAVAFNDLTTPFPTPQVGHYKTITGLYNGMIAPLTPFGIKGVLWYQGESNGPFWLQYRELLPALIADWRNRFEAGNVPFLIVSLANLNALQTKPIEPGWAELRESQWRTVRTVPNTGLAMTIDIGDAKDIHPRNKQEVGRRLSLVARHLVYGEKDLVYSGPEYTSMKIEGPQRDKIRLHFKHVGGGLAIKQGDAKLTGFVIAGADKKFVWADAVIDGSTIVVSSPEVPEPQQVRYGWAWNPIVNLYNREGLPAITFRTDE